MSASLRAGNSSLAAGAILLLVPKCPMCLAAYLSAVGLGTAAAAAVVPWLRPVGVGLFALALALFLWARRRRRRGACSATRQPSP